MENSSKALIIAAEILIGVIILTIFAILITNYRTTNDQVKEQMTVKEINAFNTQFTKYFEYDSNGQRYIAAPNVVTIANLADEINDKYGYAAMKINTCVNIPGDGIKAYNDMNGELVRKYFYDANGNLKKDRMYKDVTISGVKKVVTVYYEVYILNTDYSSNVDYTKEGRLRDVTVFLSSGAAHYKDENGQIK